MSQVVIGMDPHKRSATIKIMAGDKAILGGGRYATDARAAATGPGGHVGAATDSSAAGFNRHRHFGEVTSRAHH
jgi:hypothetical protein